MARKHQLSKSESQAIASNFISNPLRQQLQDIVDKWNCEADGFSLTTEEVFYHVIRTLDEIWRISDPNERRTYCKRFQARLQNHLADQVETERKDLERAVALVVGAVSQSLFVVDSFGYIDEIAILKASTPLRNDLNEAFRCWITGEHAKELRNWLTAYRNSPQCISAEIEKVVLNIRTNITEHIKLATPMDLSKLDTSHMTHLTIVGDNATNIEHVEHYHEANKHPIEQATTPSPFEEVKSPEEDINPLIRFIFDDKERDKVTKGLQLCTDAAQVAEFAKIIYTEEILTAEVLRSANFHRAIIPLLKFETTEAAIKQAIQKRV